MFWVETIDHLSADGTAREQERTDCKLRNQAARDYEAYLRATFRDANLSVNAWSSPRRGKLAEYDIPQDCGFPATC